MIYTVYYRLLLLRMLHGVNEDGQQKIGGFWSKLAKEWRCAAVYAKKTQEFKDIIKASVLEASTEPTVKKRPVGLTKVQTDSNVKVLFHVHTGWQDKNIILSHVVVVFRILRVLIQREPQNPR